MHRFTYHSEFDVPAGRLFAWHERPGALRRLNPPWSPASFEQESGIKDGSRLLLKVPLGPFKMSWLAEHRNYRAGEQFEDVQLEGPFAQWTHLHRFESLGPERSRLSDIIEYRVPFGALGRIFEPFFVRRDLERVFRYRHTMVRNDLLLTSRMSANRPLKILMSGASGLIGEALEAFLSVAGHEVWKLVRREPRTGKREIRWDPLRSAIDPGSIEGFDVAVHLGGEGIAKRRWSEAFKVELEQSRVPPTALLAKTLASLSKKPRVFVCASAIGFYGERGTENLTELSPQGEGFLPDLSRRWEDASRLAEAGGIRTVQARFGVVLSPRGGMLKKVLTPFLLGAGGALGSGTQQLSWISIDDAVGALYHAIVTDRVRGPVNITAPSPVSNSEFTKTLAAVLRRPALFPVPAPIIRTVFGEMGGALLLGSTRALPLELQETGYRFLYPDLESALRHQLGREHATVPARSSR